MEFFNVLKEDGTPTNEFVSREKAHRTGILHATSQVFVVRKKEGRLFVLLQKRSDNKDSFPGCWDMSCAGHVSLGMNYFDTAQKELSEELGLTVKPEELIPLFLHKTEIRDTFYGKPFIDRQISQVYLLVKDVEEEEIHFGQDEISCVKWVEATALLQKLKTDPRGYCIDPVKLEKALVLCAKYV